MLQRQGKQLSVDFPTMPKLTQPLPSEIVDINMERRKATEKYAKANARQRQVVDEIMRMVVESDEDAAQPLPDGDGHGRHAKNCVFLEGEGGTGMHGGGHD